MILFGQYTTAQREEALADAEHRLDVKDHAPTVELPVKNVKTMPELFQPREFFKGADGGRATTDEWHVKSLKRAVSIYGDIDPPLVIKLRGTGFVIVDGHHTLEAYKRAKKTAIRCEWFAGTVREALDQSMLRNGKDKLAVRQVDRMQEGWKRVLLGGWTAEQIKAVCGISTRQVGTMRQIVRVAEENSKRGWAFRARLKEHTKHCRLEATPLERLKEISWQVARAIRANVSVEEATVEEDAAALARALVSKMERKLTRDTAVTALALKLYDAKLPKQLMAEWAAMDTVDPEAIERARAEWEKRKAAASDRARSAARTRARNEAEGKVAQAVNDRMYAKEPEERRRAEERLREAQDALRALKAEQEEQEAQRAQGAVGTLKGEQGNGGGARKTH
jgi:ParB-like nuclease domain